MAEQNTKSPYLTGGALPVYKEAGMTSHDVVGRIRRLFSTRAVGHTGTLDPMAEGILVILIGKCTKCERFLVSDSKEYVASLLLGVTTDTQDSTGTVLSRSETLPSFEEVEKAALTFLGIAFYGIEFVCGAINVIVLPFIDLEKKLPQINKDLLERKKQAVLARGEEWIDPDELDRMEREKAEKEQEENRIRDLKERCQKRGLDFEEENRKYLEKKARKEAKKAKKK